jgi:hypothetical protein
MTARRPFACSARASSRGRHRCSSSTSGRSGFASGRRPRPTPSTSTARVRRRGSAGRLRLLKRTRMTEIRVRAAWPRFVRRARRSTPPRSTKFGDRAGLSQAKEPKSTVNGTVLRGALKPRVAIDARGTAAATWDATALGSGSAPHTRSVRGPPNGRRPLLAPFENVPSVNPLPGDTTSSARRAEASVRRLSCRQAMARLARDAECERDLVPGPAACAGDLDRLAQAGLVGALRPLKRKRSDVDRRFDRPSRCRDSDRWRAAQLASRLVRSGRLCIAS